jgi:hypothetical protein
MNTPKAKQPPMPLVSTAPEGKHQFWMVYVGGMDQPKMKFEFFADALKSAKHLCRKNQSRKVYVLESIGVFEPEWAALRQAARKEKLPEITPH